MKKNPIGLLLLCLMSVACSKKTTEEVTPTPVPEPVAIITPAPVTVTATGTLTGIALPLGAVKSVSASAQSGGKSYRATVEAGTGTFTLDNLPEGQYSVTYAANDYFSSPDKTTVTVTAGKSTEAATATARQRRFPLSCYVNGRYEGWNWKGTYSPTSGLFQLTNFYTGGSMGGQLELEISYRLSINISKLAGPGTYECSEASGNIITYNGIRNGLALSQQSTNISGSTGTIIITEFDQTARTIKGTFTAKLAARGTGDVKDITNGMINAKF